MTCKLQTEDGDFSIASVEKIVSIDGHDKQLYKSVPLLSTAILVCYPPERYFSAFHSFGILRGAEFSKKPGLRGIVGIKGGQESRGEPHSSHHTLREVRQVTA